MEKQESSKNTENISDTITAIDGALDKLMLDTQLNKYDIILLVRRWAYELSFKQGETRSLQELIAVAIHDILSSKVSHKMVRELPRLTIKKLKAISPQAVLEALNAVGKTEGEKKSSKKN